MSILIQAFHPLYFVLNTVEMSQKENKLIRFIKSKQKKLIKNWAKK